MLKIGQRSYHWRKFGQAGGKMLRIRSGKERVRYLFYVKLVHLMEASGQEWKYGIGSVGGYGALGGRV